MGRNERSTEDSSWNANETNAITTAEKAAHEYTI
jgi:hypothetical protein